MGASRRARAEDTSGWGGRGAGAHCVRSTVTARYVDVLEAYTRVRGTARAPPHYAGVVLTASSDVIGWRLAADPTVEVRVLPLGLACCAVEVDAAVSSGQLVPSDSVPGAPEVGVSVLVVAGTVTVPLVPVLERALAGIPGRVSVLAFGACASTGGPYWDSPTVVNGADVVVPVEQYVPGCPPSPESLVAAIRDVAAR